MDTTEQLGRQLLDEYGLNEVTYRLLKLVDEPMDWSAIKPIAVHSKITGNPAQALHKLVDRGLLAGPARTEHVNTRPFEVTEKGRLILARIKRRLHRPEWITLARAEALRLLAEKVYLDDDELRPPVRLITLQSLEKAGYIYKVRQRLWTLSGRGQEAWAEWSQHQKGGPDATH